MNTEFHKDRRTELLAHMPNKSFVVISSGHLIIYSNDQNYPFEVNRNFYYFTGIDFPGMSLLIYKTMGEGKTALFIPRKDPLKEKWTGIIPSTVDCALLSGIDEEDIFFDNELNRQIHSLITSSGADKCFLYHMAVAEDCPESDIGMLYKKISARYPFLKINDLSGITSPMRFIKTQEEVLALRESINVTKKALEHMCKRLKVGMMEYEAQAEFEYIVKKNDCKLSFDTICASGDNGVILHYISNKNEMKENTLLLIDCGASKQHYNADITRTFPVSGRFTKEQRLYYDIVLSANKLVISLIKPGVTLLELNNAVKDYYSEELKKTGLINENSEVGDYYYHSISHSLGLDTHDTLDKTFPLLPGMVITVEPGLYIKQLSIGIRIEDDVVLTQSGCEVLSSDIPKEAADIEALMMK